MKKLGFALVPRKPSIEEIVKYCNCLYEAYPDAPILIAMQERDGEDMEQLRRSPNVDLFTTKGKLGVVGYGYDLMAHARAMEINYLFFNTGLWRYDVETFVKFIKDSGRCIGNTAHLIIGVPPILHPNKSDQIDLQQLEKPAIRQRLLVDLFLNYAVTTALDIGFTNINAGMFAVKREAIKHLMGVTNYDDSSLLCSQIFWHTHRSDNNFTIKEVGVCKLQLENLGFDIKKAVDEIKFIFLARQSVGKWVDPSALVASFFAAKKDWNRWVKEVVDEDWFHDTLIPKIEESLGIKRKN